MLRGEFIRGDGLVIPNNIMTYGIEQILRWALQGDSPQLHMALADCNPTPGLLIQSLGEPTIGTNGYARQPLAQNNTDWPTTGTLNGEFYIESKAVVFTASGGNFSVPVTRTALVNSLAATTGQLVVALSNPFPASLLITPTTPEVERTFKYRIYGR